MSLRSEQCLANLIHKRNLKNEHQETWSLRPPLKLLQSKMPPPRFNTGPTSKICVPTDIKRAGEKDTSSLQQDGGVTSSATATVIEFFAGGPRSGWQHLKQTSKTLTTATEAKTSTKCTYAHSRLLLPCLHSSANRAVYMTGEDGPGIY